MSNLKLTFILGVVHSLYYRPVSLMLICFAKARGIFIYYYQVTYGRQVKQGIYLNHALLLQLGNFMRDPVEVNIVPRLDRCLTGDEMDHSLKIPECSDLCAVVEGTLIIFQSFVYLSLLGWCQMFTIIFKWICLGDLRQH